MHTKLLFVDDDLAVLSAYQRMLRQSSYQCLFEADPKVVLNETDLSDVQVLFVDQRMPGLSGAQLLTALQGRFPAMKRVLLSGDVMTAKHELADSVSLSAVLAKPCSKMALLNCIRQLLGEK